MNRLLAADRSPDPATAGLTLPHLTTKENGVKYASLVHGTCLALHCRNAFRHCRPGLYDLATGLGTDLPKDVARKETRRGRNKLRIWPGSCKHVMGYTGQNN
jgi:hypothetical protein